MVITPLDWIPIHPRFVTLFFMWQRLLPKVADGHHRLSRHLPIKNVRAIVTLVVRAYLDDLLCITKASLEDHLDMLQKVLTRLRDAGLGVNIQTSSFCAIKTEYLGYILMLTGV